MLTREENERLCRVGAATPMGRMLRRYWMPAALCGDVLADGAPQRVRLLGENLVLFRDSRGRLGLLSEHCPHRGASLVLARNEDCGLRCLYHGWKINVDGDVLDTPPEPEEYDFKNRVRAVAYRVHEAGGIIWAYIGPPEHTPPTMDFEFTAVPDTHRLIIRAREECNWVQALEGVIDSSHSNILHSDAIRPSAAAALSRMSSDRFVDRPSNDPKPRIFLQNTDYGFRYAAVRKPIVDAETYAYVRVTLFIAPFYGMFSAAADRGSFQCFVPIDDDHTMYYFVQTNRDEPFTDASRKGRLEAAGMRPGIDLNPDFSKIRNRANNWMQDREAMESGRSFTGIFGLNNEDMVVQESMGSIYDRSQEHLGTSDMAIIRMRRLMLDAVTRFERGDSPIGLARDVPYVRLRAEERMVPHGQTWHTVGAAAGELIDEKATV